MITMLGVGLYTLTFFLTILHPIHACDAPNPAFALPHFEPRSSSLKSTSHRIIDSLKSIISNSQYDRSSFSVAVTSQTEHLMGFYHTARERSDLFDGGAPQINGSTRYRIASMTKPFTVLAILQLQKAGKLNLDDSVLEYLPSLAEHQSGSLPFKDITIRALMSQQAGIPRDFAQDDILNDPETRDRLALPELDPKDIDLPQCDEMVNFTRSCNATDLLTYVKTLPPLFAPNQHSSYSNINYDLLGLVIANVSGTPYDDYIQTQILQPVGLNETSFTHPPNSLAAITKGTEYYWPLSIGVQNPTGGLYSSANDLSIWLRYVLSTYNGQTPALNWFAPTSFGSMQGFYGAPWETYRARVGDVISGKGFKGAADSGKEGENGKRRNRSTRPMTFVTKGGGLPGYVSIVAILPEYGLGITVLVAGDGDLLEEISDVVIRETVGYAEGVAMSELRDNYVGTYESEDGTIRFVLEQSETRGLWISLFKKIAPSAVSSSSYAVRDVSSHETDILASFQSGFGLLSSDFGSPLGQRQRARKREQASESAVLEEEPLVINHVVPTLLFIDEKNQRGARWRIVPQVEAPMDSKPQSIWDNFCVDNWDIGQYGGKPLNEIVFWTPDSDDDDTKIVEIDLTAWRAKLRRVVEEGDERGINADAGVSVDKGEMGQEVLVEQM